MVFDASLGAARDENHMANAGGIRFFHSILNERFVHHRQHLFGRRFGCRQKSRA